MKSNLIKIVCIFGITLFFSTNILAQAQFKVLLVTKTGGWHHESILDGVTAMKALAERNSFELQRHQDGTKLTDETLKKYDVVIFLNTTMNILDADEKEAFKRFIQSGKGFVGIHAASDTEYEWAWYTKLVGRMFHIHPAQQTAKLKITDPNFPGLEHFPKTILWTDEWYEFGKEQVNGLKYLISVDEKTFDPKVTWKDRDTDASGKKVDRTGIGMGDFHPISWYHHYDGGRSFYTALGHIPLVYKNQWFLDHVYGGIYWAATGKGIEN
jgi:type 1 glutamine amidotransferase